MGMAANPGILSANGGRMMRQDVGRMMPGDPSLMMQPDGDMMIPGDHTMGMPVGVDHYVDQYHHDMYLNSYANAEFVPVGVFRGVYYKGDQNMPCCCCRLACI
jgi:hypothetical protein